jgi:hypothetical protein
MLNVASVGSASSVYGIFETQNSSHRATSALVGVPDEDEVVGTGETAAPAPALGVSVAIA